MYFEMPSRFACVCYTVSALVINGLNACIQSLIFIASQSQVQCFDQCGNTAVTLSLTDNTATCCNSGGGAFIDVLNEGAECQECVDLGSKLYIAIAFPSKLIHNINFMFRSISISHHSIVSDRNV